MQKRYNFYKSFDKIKIDDYGIRIQIREKDMYISDITSRRLDLMPHSQIHTCIHTHSYTHTHAYTHTHTKV